MSSQADVLVLDSRDTPVAAIEVKNLLNLQPPEATVVRRNLMVHGLVAPVDYFLLVSQDVGYLWGPPKRSVLDAPPDLSFPMAPVLQRYAVEPAPTGRLFESQLELLVSSWIQELASSANQPQGEPELTLQRAGFTSAVRRGTVLTHTS